MTALDTLKQASFYEVGLTIKGEQLRMAAKNKPPSELLESLKANKPILIKYLGLYPKADFETAKAAWFNHYFTCRACKTHHTKLRPPPKHPCNEGELLNAVYSNSTC